MISRRVTSAWEHAVAQWPELDVPHDRFCAIYQRLSETSGGEALALEAPDLYLAVACLEGDARALHQLQQLVEGQLKLLASFRLSADESDELVQRTMTALLIGGPQGTPKLTLYGGRGTLQSWLHVLMVRDVVDRLRTKRVELPTDDDVLLGIPDDGLDVELEALKQRYRGHFGQAFRDALLVLSRRQRNLLRQHYLDELSLEQLGAMYRVHRSTAARWLEEARAAVLSHTRDAIAAATGIPRLEVDSLMRVVQSRLNLSAGLFLSTATTRPSEDA